MQKKTLPILVALGLLLGGSAWATTMIRFNQDDLIRLADTIIVGRVALPPRPVVGSAGRHIFSKITILVDEYVKAPPLQQEIQQIEIVQPGGTYNGKTTVVPGVPAFRQSERVFLYLKQNPKTGQYGVVGLAQGKFEIRTDPDSGRDYLVPSAVQANLVSAKPAAAAKADATTEPGTTTLRKPGKRYLDDVIKEIKLREDPNSPVGRLINKRP